MAVDDAEAVAKVFAESDATELPGLAGVSRRTLFEYHGLYFHLIEADHDLRSNVNDLRRHPLFTDVSAKLESYIGTYDPAWSKPTDAMARPFYQWSPSHGSSFRPLDS
jgi:cyclase